MKKKKSKSSDVIEFWMGVAWTLVFFAWPLVFVALFVFAMYQNSK